MLTAFANKYKLTLSVRHVKHNLKIIGIIKTVRSYYTEKSAG